MKWTQILTLATLSTTLLLTSCASRKWTAQSSNPVVAKEAGADSNSLKTEWGFVRIVYDKTTDEGVFFNIELKNESNKVVKYERSYLYLQNESGANLTDLQNTFIGRNVANSALSAANGNKVDFLISGVKALYQTHKAMGNGDIAAGALHTDRLVFPVHAVKGSKMTIYMGKELVSSGKLNSIMFVADSK